MKETIKDGMQNNVQSPRKWKPRSMIPKLLEPSHDFLQNQD